MVPDESLYFAGPREAVVQADDLLLAEDWEQLARYYDLDGSELAYEDIARWEWFEHGGQPVADPHGRAGPHHPFPRGATYREHTVEGGIARVTIETDPAVVLPGTGSNLPTDHGIKKRAFHLVRHEEGWQLLAPDDARLDS